MLTTAEAQLFCETLSTDYAVISPHSTSFHYAFGTRFSNGPFCDHHTDASLNTAITLHQHVLKLCPAGHPDHSTTWADLDQAVQLHQVAMGLLTPEDPGYDTYLESLRLPWK
ncbi:hypothetical protein M404DRAFT_381778 [Pisolithus tinctorius Marx 270]|uniref:Uncharacterized protein n=1 Tax=Pisolithus tinctorius Marx 270 TaxID=870435 RepID=A0A0C3NG95_PISTI|nr:hypothetical protein M404DRAFT_381778 [Pisolithus tinctorius Marx 270]